MAAEVQPADGSEQVIPSRRKESLGEIFLPKDTLDQPCDVVLMVKDGREFKAHRRVLSETGPFFQKLLNSDMKEAQEGVVRLEMFTESIMAATLQFIYTGDVQILAEDNARELIVVADYLFLDKLKLLAGRVLVQTLNTSNCISLYHFAERYQCEDLLSNTRKFVLANFTSIYAANREDVLNMSSREVEMLISSDEIDVTAEEDVFKIILAWTDYDSSRRRRYFVELFRHVRLFYVSPDFLLHDIVTNELVKNSNSCLRLVKDAINLLESKSYDSLSVPPRKSLKTSVIVINVRNDILCYFPSENSWCKLGELTDDVHTIDKFVPCGGQLYGAVQESPYYRPQCIKQIKYNPLSNSWMQLPSLKEPGRYLRKTFVGNGDEMYALMSELCVLDHLLHQIREGRRDCESRKHTPFLVKLKPELNSWKNLSSFNHLDLRHSFCIVTNDNFIYFIGGSEWCCNKFKLLCNVDRYDLSKNQWEKVADIQMARVRVMGAAVNKKFYIVGETALPTPRAWEVYDETTNEWQFITGIRDGLGYCVDILGVDGKLYALGSKPVFRSENDPLLCIRIERFNLEEKKWEMETEVSERSARISFVPFAIVCSMRIFKGLVNIRQAVEAFRSEDSLPGAATAQPSFHVKKRDCNCLII